MNHILNRALPAGAPRLRKPHSRTIATLTLAASTLGSALADETLSLRRQDGRSFEISVRAPSGATCRGIALVSPGAGGSAQGYRYLAEALASIGHLTVVIGHPESGRLALREHARGQGLREGLAELITEPEAYRARFMDIAAARQWASSRCNAPQAILVGHSMGAATVMIEAGARNRLGLQGSDAFDAYIALSPQGSGSIFPADAWSDVRKPTLLLTGTRDNELGGRSWETRTEPFASLPPGCKWLGVIDGATHMHFAGNGLAQRSEALTIRTIGAFLEARTRGDCAPPPRARGIEVSAK
jgi:predicted dienelactone hydrolase